MFEKQRTKPDLPF